MQEVHGDDMISRRSVENSTIWSGGDPGHVAYTMDAVSAELLDVSVHSRPVDYGLEMLQGCLHATMSTTLRVGHDHEFGADLSIRDQNLAATFPDSFRCNRRYIALLLREL